MPPTYSMVPGHPHLSFQAPRKVEGSWGCEYRLVIYSCFWGTSMSEDCK